MSFDLNDLFKASISKNSCTGIQASTYEFGVGDQFGL